MIARYDTEPVVDTTAVHGDWRDQLYRDGYVVVKNVVSPDRAQYYLDNMFEWLESFPFGFKKEDKATWGPQNLPAHIKGGMYVGYSIAHEKFYWEARTEPGLIDAFAKLWGTDKLLVSFDGFNITLPAEQHPKSEAWPHVDQSPLRKGMQCVQGILNLAPNGPQDGGLIVMKGSSAVSERFFKENIATEKTSWGPADWYGFDSPQVEWFKNKGCEFVKVCADQGDLILWDSRTIHYNCLPESNTVRSVLYMCYTPAAYANAEDLKTKAMLFDKRMSTTHWPHANIYANDQPQIRLGLPETYERSRPLNEPEITPQVLRLAGVQPYA